MKVIVELKGEVTGSDLVSPDDAQTVKKVSKTPADPEREAIINSLAAMGYDRKSVESAVDAVTKEGLSVSERTVLTLKALSK